MTTQEFVARFSIARRHLTGACDGVTVHLCRVPGSGGRHFGAVIDGDEAWVMPLRPIQVNGFISQTARAVYDAVTQESRDAQRRAA